MDEPSKYTVAVYELINQQGDKLPLKPIYVRQFIPNLG